MQTELNEMRILLLETNAQILRNRIALKAELMGGEPYEMPELWERDYPNGV